MRGTWSSEADHISVWDLFQVSICVCIYSAHHILCVLNLAVAATGGQASREVSSEGSEERKRKKEKSDQRLSCNSRVNQRSRQNRASPAARIAVLQNKG